MKSKNNGGVKIMRFLSWNNLVLVIGLPTLLGLSPLCGVSADKIHVLVFTGGHDFERDPFFTLFKGYDDIEYQEVVHPKANQVFTDGTAMKADVLVLYDMWTQITDEQKAGLLNYLKAGKGIVSLHHSIANYTDWPEYLNIIGGTYITDPKGRKIDDKFYPTSKYLHNVKFPVQIADPNHPITQGLHDFEVLDETYGDFYVSPEVHVILKANHPTSGPIVGWTKNYGPARIAYLQLGHDHNSFQNPNYRSLVYQAIRWAAKPKSFSLFNGKDLTGWEKVGDADWTVKDGIIIGKQNAQLKGGELLSTQEFHDFELTVDFKVKWPANSGVWFRYQNSNAAYQADILKYTNPVCYSGSLYCLGKTFIALNTDPKIVKDDDWNTFVIRCQGDHITIGLNGKQVADVHDSSSDRGKIGFQVHTGDELKGMAIMIRKAELTPIE